MRGGFQVVWAPSAVRDLDLILEYIANDQGIDRALRLYEKIRNQVDLLQEQPARCRWVPELKDLGVETYRELILPPYRICFRLEESRVVLLGVLDSRRDLEELLVRRLLDLELE
jgi:toxin ParE1/3/4